MHIRKVELTDIDVDDLSLVKESISWIDRRDHSRWVFRGQIPKLFDQQPVFIKIWNPTYVRRDNLDEALRIGFYDRSNASALTALIRHNGVSRGYVTFACRINFRQVNEFFDALKQKTIKKSMFAIQFSEFHIGLVNGSYSLFDLEGVHSIASLPTMPSLRSFFDDERYCKFVLKLYKQQFPERRPEISIDSLLPQLSVGRRLKRSLGYRGHARSVRIIKAKIALELNRLSSDDNRHLIIR